MTVRRQPINKFAFDASYRRTVHSAELPFDVTIEDIMVPAYWGAVSSQLKAGSIIEAFRPDFSLDVQLRVTHVERGLAVVHLLGGFYQRDAETKVKELRADAAIAKAGAVDQDAAVPEGLDDYKIGNAPSGFYVQYKPTHDTIASKLASKAAAIDFAVKHRARAMAGADANVT